jgi:hypothetical protein
MTGDPTPLTQTIAQVAAFVARHAYHAPGCRPDGDEPFCACGMSQLRAMVLRPRPKVYHDCICAHPCDCGPARTLKGELRP